MYIKDFAEKYGLDRRTVDYWTTIGLLHPKVLPNGYREYGEQAEIEVGNILVANQLDIPGSIEHRCEMLENLEPYQWRDIVRKLESKHKDDESKYDIAYSIASTRIKE